MSKLVKCVRENNYNLTLNKEYEATVDVNNGNRYNLINDRNIVGRYGTNIFEDVIEEVIPVAPPAPVKNTIEHILHNINNVNGSFVVEIFQGQTANIHKGIFNTHACDISCGLTSFSGITNIYRGISDNVGVLELTQAEKIALTNRLYLLMLTEFLDTITVGGAIASTNTNCQGFENMDEIISTFNVSSSRMDNPNSGNEIIVYVFNLEQDLDEEDEEDFDMVEENDDFEDVLE